MTSRSRGGSSRGRRFSAAAPRQQPTGEPLLFARDEELAALADEDTRAAVEEAVELLQTAGKRGGAGARGIALRIGEQADGAHLLAAPHAAEPPAARFDVPALGGEADMGDRIGVMRLEGTA